MEFQLRYDMTTNGVYMPWDNRDLRRNFSRDRK